MFLQAFLSAVCNNKSLVQTYGAAEDTMFTSCCLVSRHRTHLYVTYVFVPSLRSDKRHGALKKSFNLKSFSRSALPLLNSGRKRSTWAVKGQMLGIYFSSLSSLFSSPPARPDDNSTPAPLRVSPLSLYLSIYLPRLSLSSFSAVTSSGQLPRVALSRTKPGFVYMATERRDGRDAEAERHERGGN